jgi:thiol-disulfide isomerase/thioredoxin
MRLRIIGIPALGLFLMGLSASRITHAGAEAPLAPAFDIVTLQGVSYNRDSLKGQPALLIFWAPWCGVCRRELPELAKFYQNDKPKPLRMLSVGFADLRTSPLGCLCISDRLR